MDLVLQLSMSFFGKAFKQAADKTGSKAELEFFDANIIQLSVEDTIKIKSNEIILIVFLKSPRIKSNIGIRLNNVISRLN